MSDQPNPESNQPRRKIRITASDDIKHGAYANFVAVQHGPHEFTLDFGQAMPGSADGDVTIDVVARVKVAPTLIGQLMRSLANAQSKYEDKFGSIKAIG
jgi:hypothetical protein